MSLQYNKNMIQRAKELRKNSTPEEKKLWYEFLSKYQPRFQRQKTIDSYIADFFCHKAKLVIELDGHYHFTEDAMIYDQIRTKVLNEYDLYVLRFTNIEIRDHFKHVCDSINTTMRQRIDYSANHGGSTG
jgi:very-short-patch-repair endonuclease